MEAQIAQSGPEDTTHDVASLAGEDALLYTTGTLADGHANGSECQTANVQIYIASQPSSPADQAPRAHFAPLTEQRRRAFTPVQFAAAVSVNAGPVCNQAPEGSWAPEFYISDPASSSQHPVGDGAGCTDTQDMLTVGTSSSRCTALAEAAWTPEKVFYSCTQRLECTQSHAEIGTNPDQAMVPSSPAANIDSVASLCVDWLSNTEENWHQVTRQIKTAVCEERKKIRNAIVDRIRGDIHAPHEAIMQMPAPRVYASPARNRALPALNSDSTQASGQEMTLNTASSSSTASDSCTDGPPTCSHMHKAPIVLIQHVSEVVCEADEGNEKENNADTAGRRHGKKGVCRRLQPGALRFDDSWWLAQLTESEIADLEAKGRRTQEEAAARAAAAEFLDELRAPRPLEDEQGSESGTPRPDAGDQDPGLPHPGQRNRSNLGVAKKDPVQGSSAGSAVGSNPVSDQPPSVRLGQRLWALFWSPRVPDPVSERECSRCEGAAAEANHQGEVRAAARDGATTSDPGVCGSSGPARQEDIEIEEGLEASSAR